MTTLSLSAADMFFSQTLLQNDWDKYDDAEKTASIYEAQRTIELNSDDTIANIETALNIQAPYVFGEFVYMQSFYMLENAERYRSTSSPLAIMHLAEGGTKRSPISLPSL